MSIEDSLKEGNTVTFRTKVPALLGELYSSVEVISVMTYKAARLIDYTIASKHESALSALSGVSSNPNDLKYIQVLDRNERASILAMEWIDENSILISGEQTYSVMITGATPDKMNKLRRFAIDLGIGLNFS